MNCLVIFPATSNLNILSVFLVPNDLFHFFRSMDPFHSLRRLDYPEVTKAALQQLRHCLGQEGVIIPGLGGGVEELAEALVRDFIFFQGYGGKVMYHSLSIIVTVFISPASLI